MRNLKVVIVDDERASIESLQILLGKFCSDVEIAGSAGDVKSAISIINSLNPDVVFLDIQMPDGTGFDVIEAIPNRNFEIIFITAYSHYAVKSLKYSAVEFLQKPVNKNDLTAAISKVKSTKGIVQESSKRYSILFENLSQELPNKLCLPSNGRYEYVDIDNIDGFEESMGLVKFFLTDGCIVETIKSIDHFEDILEGRGFYRFTNELLLCHSKITTITDGIIILKGGRRIEVPASRIFEFKINMGISFN